MTMMRPSESEVIEKAPSQTSDAPDDNEVKPDQQDSQPLV